MYNLVGIVEQLARHLDQSKMGMLAQVKAVTSKMISLTRKAKEPPPTTQSTSTSDSVPEGGRNGEAQDISAPLVRMIFKLS
jgi:hypothetical protein